MIQEKKKILLLTPDFPPRRGGVARYLSCLCNHFQERITVIADIDSRWQEFDPKAQYPVYRMPLLYKAFWPKWWKVTRYLKSVRSEYDVFFISHILPYGTAAMLANVPYILFVHGMDIRLAGQSTKKKTLAKKVLKKARLVIVNSQALSEELARDYGIGSLVIYPCIEEIDHEIRTELHQDCTVLSVSRLVERKGHIQVLNALAALKQSAKLSGVRYNIIGSGPMEQTLRSMVHELGLDSTVTFLGEVSDQNLRLAYSQSDIFILPVVNDKIDKEGFGLVFIEAARFGIPSITSNISGVNEAVVDKETGLLINPDDPDELVQALELLILNPEYRHQLGENAKKRVQDSFMCSSQFQKLEPYL